VARIAPNVFVYTRSKQISFRLTDLSQIGAKVAELTRKDYLKAGRQVAFIVHGFWNNELFSWQYGVKRALLEAEDSTVIIVTWGAGSLVPLYTQAGANTKTVASVVAELSKAITNSAVFKQDPKSLYLYCIGHSLGAQICGQAGRLAGNFNRVTGLDPAGPGFEKCWSENKVDTRSAACVDHIHTDGSGKGHANSVVPYFGTLNSWGHVDFFPNGGEDQPGCNMLNNDAAACSHMKAIDFFVYSVQNKGTCVSKNKCATPEKCEAHPGQQMGYYSSCHKDNKQAVQGGNFHLKTAAKAPFC
jgi:hypothetical protein